MLKKKELGSNEHSEELDQFGDKSDTKNDKIRENLLILRNSLLEKFFALKNSNERGLEGVIGRRDRISRKLEAIEEGNDGEVAKDLVKDLKLEEKACLAHSLDNLDVEEILGRISFEELLTRVFSATDSDHDSLKKFSGNSVKTGSGLGAANFQAKIEALKKLLNAILGRGRRYCDFLNNNVFGEIEQCKSVLEKGQQEY